MKTWTDTHFNLEPTDTLTICNHAETMGTVSLNLPGYCTDGRGFSVQFTTAHIGALAHLLSELQDLKALEERADHNLAIEDKEAA